MYTPRIIEQIILDFIKNDKPPYHCLLVGGARQCGKSTLLKHLFPAEKHIHINLALESGFCDQIDQTQSFDDFTFLLESRYKYKVGGNKIIIIDEAQLSKKLGGYVRFFKEEWKNQRVILSGSTLSDLFDRHQKPTGRVVTFVVRPFNFHEFLLALDKKPLLEKLDNWFVAKPFSETIHREAVKSLKEYLEVGGLPEVVLAYKEKQDYLTLLANIFSFYKRDFENKVGNSRAGIFSQCFLRIAAATGSPIKNSSIIKSSSPGYQHVQQVLAILESWHQILKVEWETSKFSKVGTITPKRYIFDHGIRFLQNPSRFRDMDLLDAQDPKREEVGGVLENFVLTELLSLHNPLPIKSWGKTHQSGLVDFVYLTKNKTCALEVKAAQKFDTKNISALLEFNSFYPKSQMVLGNLGTGGIHPTSEKSKVLNIPIYAIYSWFTNNF